MKKKLLLLVMSVCLIALLWGCKKDAASDLDSNDDKEGTEQTTVTPAATEGTEVAPTKEAYEVSDYITLGEYKGVNVTVEKIEVTEEDINARIQEELSASATEEEVTGRPVENGDIVNIDYEGLKDGVAFEGGTAQGQDLEIGSNSFIPGFEEGLVGANVGEKLDLNLSFPADYSAPDLAGQAVVFKVTVNSIKKTVVPELTEEYVKENTDYETINAYKEGSRVALQAENEEIMKNNKINSVMQAIIKNAEVKSVPESLINYYVYEMKSYYTQYAQAFGMDFASFLSASGLTEEKFNTEAQTYANERATQELVLNAIVKAEGMEITEDEYKAGIANIVSEYGYPSEEELLKSVKEEQIKESLLWEKAMNFVTEQAVES
jgi:trigger factor